MEFTMYAVKITSDNAEERNIQRIKESKRVNRVLQKMKNVQRFDDELNRIIGVDSKLECGMKVMFYYDRTKTSGAVCKVIGTCENNNTKYLLVQSKITQGPSLFHHYSNVIMVPKSKLKLVTKITSEMIKRWPTLESEYLFM